MTDHEIVWTFEGAWADVRAEMVCHASADAPCHQRPSCGCEGWDLQQDDAGYYHECEGERHEHHPVPDCGVGEWLNADSPMECAVKGVEFEIGRTPIVPVWNGDYMQWEPTIRDWERELLT